ncbi:MAG: DUF4129 domain-containing protein, partial [Armatimonadota bacterium]
GRPGFDEGPAQGLGPEGEGREGDEDAPGPGEEQGEGAASDEGDPGDEGVGAEEGSAASSGGEEQGEGEGEAEGQETEPSADGEEAWTPEFEAPSGIARLLMIALLIAAALAIAYFAWVWRRQIVAALRHAAMIPVLAGRAIARGWRRFLLWLRNLGLPIRVRADGGNLPDDPFVDIFAGGLADGLAPAEIVRYVYRAFQVYTARGGYQRRDDQTALEFLRELPPGLELPDHGAERLTRAYVLATYSPREVTEAQVRGARETWTMMKERLESAAGTAASH